MPEYKLHFVRGSRLWTTTFVVAPSLDAAVSLGKHIARTTPHMAGSHLDKVFVDQQEVWDAFGVQYHGLKCLLLDTEGGTITVVAEKEETLRHYLHTYVKDNWESVFPEDPVPADRGEAINTYFDYLMQYEAGIESYIITEATYLKEVNYG